MHEMPELMADAVFPMNSMNLTDGRVGFSLYTYALPELMVDTIFRMNSMKGNKKTS